MGVAEFYKPQDAFWFYFHERILGSGSVIERANAFQFSVNTSLQRLTQALRDKSGL